MLLALPQSAAAAPLWPEGAASPTAGVVLRLFAVVFAVGAVLLLAYLFALRTASRSSAGTATAPGPKGAVYTGLATVVALALFGGFALAKSSSAESSSVESAGQSAQFYKATVFKTPSLKVAHVVKAPAGPAYSIRVNAQQFLWRYQYSGLEAPWNTYSYHELVLPAGITVLLDFTSSDVEAAWWVPQLGGSVTAMPGYANKVWIRADKPGVYRGAGTVVNGTNYASMTTTVNVVPPLLFERWVKGKQTEIGTAMTDLGAAHASGSVDALVTGAKPGAQKAGGQ